MSNFPFDVLFDIFCCLPVASLLRFRCLSKPCCALIDSSDFVNYHLNHSVKTNTNLTLVVEDFTPYGLTYTVDLDSPLNCPTELLSRPFEPFVDGYQGTMIDGRSIGTPIKLLRDLFGSCNGILALDGPDRDLILWNPSTKKHKKLPKFWRGERSGYWYLDGFGYDVTTDDYKVVRIIQYSSQKVRSRVFVYSLKNNSSRRVEDFPYHSLEARNSGVFVGGSLHWVVRSGRMISDNNLIAAFDVGKETFHLVPILESWERSDESLGLGVLSGCLSISCKRYGDERVDIWMMKEYGVKESWTNVCSLSKEHENVDFCRLYMRPLCYSRTGNRILFEQDGCRVFWYDLEKKTQEMFEVSSAYVPKKIVADTFVRSLVPLNVNAITTGENKRIRGGTVRNYNKRARIRGVW